MINSVPRFGRWQRTVAQLDIVFGAKIAFSASKPADFSKGLAWLLLEFYLALLILHRRVCYDDANEWALGGMEFAIPPSFLPLFSKDY